MANRKFKQKVQLDAGLQITSVTANTALQLDGSGNVTASTTSSTELGYLSGVTSSIQTQLNAKINSTEKGAALGVATLDGSGKVPSSQLPDSVFELKGAWNASTNTPTLSDGTGNPGDVYKVTVAGTQNLGSGSITFAVNDLLLYGSDGIYFKSDSTDNVLSVNGQQGIVVLNTDNISEGAVNFYFTDTRAKTAAVVNSTAGSQIDQAPSVSATKSYVNTQIAAIDFTPYLKADGTVPLTGALNANSHKITNLTTPTVGSDAANKTYVDSAITASRSPGDIQEASTALLNNQSSPVNVSGFAFSNSVVRSFSALVSVEIVAGSNLYESFELEGIQKSSSWEMAIMSVGDDSSVVFSITSAGQIQYQSGNYASFTSGLIKYRSITTSF